MDDTYEEAMYPMSYFGYVWDGDSDYVQDNDKSISENAGNYCIVPFCLNMVIDPERGKIYESEAIPLGAWVKKIFKFNFSTMTYES
jgi:hypothetical protein